MSFQELYERRSAIDSQRSSLTADDLLDGTPANPILASWRRSANYLSLDQHSAPLEDERLVERRWKKSLLRTALANERQAIGQLIDDGRLVVAVADSRGRLLWTSSSNHMRQRAESVNFMAGARWDERSAGTNAVGLALKENSAVTVFSSEHYMSSVHDWVCYAAPIIHPTTKECVGVLDMSTTWQRHTALGETAVMGLAHSIARKLPEPEPRETLEIYVLGEPRVVFRGAPLQLPLRQIEILCLLALNPEGLTLEKFHAVLYGDNTVSAHTLKSELSHIRKLIGGNIGSRPYRLLTPVWADFVEIWKFLDRRQTEKALALYRGPLLAQSTSPELEEWRNCIEATMSMTLDQCEDTAQLIRQISANTDSSGLVRFRLEEILSTR